MILLNLKRQPILKELFYEQEQTTPVSDSHISGIPNLFFNDLADRGYEAEHFATNDQESLIQRAREAANEGRPVAIICSGLMAGNGRGPFASTYVGDRNGGDLADKLGQIEGGNSLTIVYSSTVYDDFSALETDASQQVIRLDKGKLSREPSDSDIACNAMDRFFAKQKRTM